MRGGGKGEFFEAPITFPGGLPIVDKEGVPVGAIGVSGSSVEKDHAVALAGVGSASSVDILTWIAGLPGGEGTMPSRPIVSRNRAHRDGSRKSPCRIRL